jgi:hypothetical protein
MGETGEPCGMPVMIGDIGSDSVSMERLVSVSVRKESVHLVTAGLSLICLRVWRSRCQKTLLKAPLMSMHSRWCFSAMWASLVAIIFSDIFSKQLRREMGR